MHTAFRIAFVLWFGACRTMPAGTPARVTAPARVLGSFTDDYGNAFEVSPTEFRQLPRARYHVVEWHPEGFFVARNDAANPSDGGQWTRIDWIALADMAPYTWAFCFTAYRAPSASAARETPTADRTRPRTGCNGHPFSRMRPTASERPPS